MLRQNETGRLTEMLVQQRLEALGLVARRPLRDDGVDLEVSHPASPDRVVKVQIKGRGREQTNRRYRWFQLRTTEAQRRGALARGLPAADAYKLKLAKSDFFVLVSLKFAECWVFPCSEVLELIEANKAVYGRRRDNELGIQKEIDLDIPYGNGTLAEHWAARCNAFQPIFEAAGGAWAGRGEA